MELTNNIAIVALAALFAAALFFGCVSENRQQENALGQPDQIGGNQNFPQTRGSWPENQAGRQGTQRTNASDFGNRSMDQRDRFGNMTEEERQQAFGQIMDGAAAACEGKSEGELCETQFGPRGGGNSTCKSQNGTLLCLGNMQGMPEKNARRGAQTG